ncbi:MAG: hypothetical protein ACI9ZX_003296, partial [Algoriphagus sp.]
WQRDYRWNSIDRVAFFASLENHAFLGENQIGHQKKED